MNQRAKLLLSVVVAAAVAIAILSGTTKEQTMKPKLTELEHYVIVEKGTEAPFTGEYNNFKGTGTYHCRQCDAPLYRSKDKFDSGCGWPSFDDEIEGAVKRTVDADGVRTEITCVKCGAHLGHVFTDEGFTEKETRHCVNSVSLRFVADPEESENKEATLPSEERAYFAGGCFWGVEYYFNRVKGVQSATSGYIGGVTQSPTYEDVCSGKTGHAEAVEVVFDPSEVSYLELAKLFFEIHDPTHIDRQGPDVGTQYRSEVFYTSPQQKATAERLIKMLKQKGLEVATKVTPATKFWKAEDYHQEYYKYRGGTPYCHSRVKRFD